MSGNCWHTSSAYGLRSMDFTDSVGAMATFNVSTVEGDDVNMGISQIIGYTSTGTWILATIELDTFSGNNRIRYQVREYDTSTKNNKNMVSGQYWRLQRWLEGQ